MKKLIVVLIFFIPFTSKAQHQFILDAGYAFVIDKEVAYVENPKFQFAYQFNKQINKDVALYISLALGYFETNIEETVRSNYLALEGGIGLWEQIYLGIQVGRLWQRNSFYIAGRSKIYMSDINKKRINWGLQGELGTTSNLDIYFMPTLFISGRLNKVKVKEIKMF